MNEPKCILGTCSFSWKEEVGTVSAEKSHCPAEPRSSPLYHSDCRSVGIPELWIGVWGHRHPQNSICLLLVPAMECHVLQNPEGSENQDMWALVWHITHPKCPTQTSASRSPQGWKS